jgi:hypothetical protein
MVSRGEAAAGEQCEWMVDNVGRGWPQNSRGKGRGFASENVHQQGNHLHL